jgi:hypothetical protein
LPSQEAGDQPLRKRVRNSHSPAAFFHDTTDEDKDDDKDEDQGEEDDGSSEQGDEEEQQEEQQGEQQGAENGYEGAYEGADTGAVKGVDQGGDTVSQIRPQCPRPRVRVASNACIYILRVQALMPPPRARAPAGIKPRKYGGTFNDFIKTQLLKYPLSGMTTQRFGVDKNTHIISCTDGGVQGKNVFYTRAELAVSRGGQWGFSYCPKFGPICSWRRKR